MAARRPRCSIALVALVVLSLSLGASPVMAHQTAVHLLDTRAGGGHSLGQVERLASALPAGTLLWAGLLLVGGIGLVRLATYPSCGRVIALGLSLTLGVFTAEAAVHSVHHLAEPETGATCSVLTGSQHLSWGEAQATAADTRPLRVAPAPLLPADAAPISPVYRPHQGRAPPA
jgi:hypothetical protein